MRSSFGICGLFAAAATLAVSAADPQDTARKAPSPDAITVRGCLDRTWLEVTSVDTLGSYRERYRLRGSKPLLKELSQRFHRHLIEVTGPVTDVAGTTHRGRTIQVGKKTRITTGAKEVPEIPSGDAPSIAVEEFRDIRPSCK